MHGLNRFEDVYEAATIALLVLLQPQNYIKWEQVAGFVQPGRINLQLGVPDCRVQLRRALQGLRSIQP